MPLAAEHPISRRAVLMGSAAALAAGALPTAETSAAPSGDWPCFRGPNRNGVFPEALNPLPGGPKRLWEAQVGEGRASMAIASGRLYTFGTGAVNLVCLDARTGRPIWRQTLETHFGDSTPSVEGGRLYVMPSKDGDPNTGRNGVPTACCCDAVTGNVLWKRELPASTGDRQYGHAGSPLLWEDLVILNAAGGAALKKSTGEVAWVHEGFPGLATPVLFSSQGRPAVALFGGDALTARDARSGRTLWSIPWKTSLAVNACDPVCFDNKVFICSGYGRGRALYDVGGGAPRRLWEFGEGSGHPYSSGFLHQGQLYGFTSGNFVCLDLQTGQPRWEAPGSGSALLIGDRLVRIREQGELFIGPLSAAGFRPVVTADAGMREIKAAPAYWDGRLYLRNESGRVLCLQLGTPVEP